MGAETEYGGKSMTGKICTIIGTRPEIIKMSPVARACEGAGADWFMGHSGTGQGCSRDVGRVFSGGLGLSDARYNPDVGSGSEGRKHGVQTGRMMAGIEKKITMTEYGKMSDISERTANRELSDLVKLGIFNKIGRGHNVLLCAH